MFAGWHHLLLLLLHAVALHTVAVRREGSIGPQKIFSLRGAQPLLGSHFGLAEIGGLAWLDGHVAIEDKDCGRPGGPPQDRVIFLPGRQALDAKTAVGVGLRRPDAGPIRAGSA